jgi:hypothetical protein
VKNGNESAILTSELQFSFPKIWLFRPINPEIKILENDENISLKILLRNHHKGVDHHRQQFASKKPASNCHAYIHRACRNYGGSNAQNPEIAGPKRTSLPSSSGLFGQSHFFDSWVSVEFTYNCWNSKNPTVITPKLLDGLLFFR